jgi:hypothetical protein
MVVRQQGEERGGNGAFVIVQAFFFALLRLSLSDFLIPCRTKRSWIRDKIEPKEEVRAWRREMSLKVVPTSS